MIPAAIPTNELQRLSALAEYNILDTLSEAEYDDITKIASIVCNTPVSLISLIDKDRQWFKSKVGLDVSETPRDLAFCAHAILKPDELFIVPDPKNDIRFKDNPLVTGAPNIAFYAGVPLVTTTGSALGTLCVIDNKPNELNEEQKSTLQALARLVMSKLESRKTNLELTRQKEQLERVNEDLSKFAYVVAHDIKSPVSSIQMGISMIRNAYSSGFDKDGLTLLKMLEDSSAASLTMVNGILEHTLAINKTNIVKELFDFGNLIGELKKLITIPEDFIFESVNNDIQLYSSRYVLLQILLNLCSNSIKYNDKSKGLIVVSCAESEKGYTFSVTDNGPGISTENQEKIFELFTTLGHTDRFNQLGTGIGLSTVKRLVELLGGTIEVNSVFGMGCSFTFSIPR